MCNKTSYLYFIICHFLYEVMIMMVMMMVVVVVVMILKVFAMAIAAHMK